jgi:hypothetical protein
MDDDRRLRGRPESGQSLFEDAALARRFQRRLGDVRPAGTHARPVQQYDESGYPIDSRTSLADRVRRLITG